MGRHPTKLARGVLNVNQHRRVGRLLKDVRDSLLPLIGELPCSTARLRRAIRALDQFRCQLDDQAAKDLGDDFDPELYYPGDSQHGVGVGGEQ